jgi:hypothetical protein
MSLGEILIALEVLGVAGVIWWMTRHVPVAVAPPVVQEQRRSVVRAKPQRRLVRCILMDENEVETHAILELERHQRSHIINHDGQAYSASNVTSEGFIYRRMT